MLNLNLPTGLAVDSNNHIYISDRNNNRIIRVDDMLGTNSKSLGTFGSGILQFNSPRGLSINGKDILFFSDYGNGRIGKITSINGSGWETFTTGDNTIDEFANPNGITNGVLYPLGSNYLPRCDYPTIGTWNNSFGVYESIIGNEVKISSTPQMTLQKTITLPGFTNNQLSQPYIFSVMPTMILLTDSGANMYLVDLCGNIVNKWAYDGISAPVACYLNSNGFVYVAFSKGGRNYIYKISLTSPYVTSWISSTGVPTLGLDSNVGFVLTQGKILLPQGGSADSYVIDDSTGVATTFNFNTLFTSYLQSSFPSATQLGFTQSQFFKSQDNTHLICYGTATAQDINNNLLFGGYYMALFKPSGFSFTLTSSVGRGFVSVTFPSIFGDGVSWAGNGGARNAGDPATEQFSFNYEQITKTLYPSTLPAFSQYYNFPYATSFGVLDLIYVNSSKLTQHVSLYDYSFKKLWETTQDLKGQYQTNSPTTIPWISQTSFALTYQDSVTSNYAFQVYSSGGILLSSLTFDHTQYTLQQTTTGPQNTCFFRLTDGSVLIYGAKTNGQPGDPQIFIYN